MTPVILESPYAGDIARNLDYLRRALRDSLDRGEAPFASHAIYPGALNDTIPEERAKGITAGYAWWPHAEKIIFYTDLGWSTGMRDALARAVACHMPIETRRIPHEK